MFLSIFNAASRQEELTGSQNEDQVPPWTTRWSTKPIPTQWTRPEDEILDMMKEEIEHCESDQALYAWTLERLLGELDGALSQVQLDTPESTNNDASEISSPESMQQASASLPAFAYPQLLARFMRTFRTKYRNPHTALALFDHAHNASAVSYVTCCGTAAYNELIETKWDSFRDLQGVCDALEEMNLNKVRIDTRTIKLVESLRREVGQRNFWQEEGFGESHSGVMDLLERIERTCWPTMGQAEHIAERNRNRFAPQRWRVDSEVWKRPVSNARDRLEFV
jgi:Mtf2 family